MPVYVCRSMKILLHYLSRSKMLVLLALVLAAVNQCFSLLDPYFAGRMLQQLGVEHETYVGDSQRFIHDLLIFLLILIGVAMVSRIAKNFHGRGMRYAISSGQTHHHHASRPCKQTHQPNVNTRQSCVSTAECRPPHAMWRARTEFSLAMLIGRFCG